ncbi:hypothetical protein AWN90_42205 [Nocardia terpenica]|uniref:ATP-binding protein n=1 Tax=Nocardia terpenica TaxID=455432 RepID=A0A161XCX6_9NOCA|nr:hypothetical protein AWN90_42205 [Nocardia terpenica]
MGLPLFSRDVIKEALFDTLGWSDRQRSRELGTAAASVLFALLEHTLSVGVSCVSESNFRPSQSSADFHRLLDNTGAHAVQVQCVTRGDVLLQRFATRSDSDERHPGHRDSGNLDEFRSELLAGRYEPLDLPGPVRTIDTTDFHTMNVQALAAELRVLIGSNTP